MIVCPGQLLSSVIVGAFVSGSLAMGVGAAPAAEPLTSAECSAAGGVPSVAQGKCTIGEEVRQLIVSSGSSSSDTPPSTDPSPTGGAGAGSGTGAGDTLGWVGGGVVGGVTGTGAGSGGATAGNGSATATNSPSGSSGSTTQPARSVVRRPHSA